MVEHEVQRALTTKLDASLEVLPQGVAGHAASNASRVTTFFVPKPWSGQVATTRSGASPRAATVPHSFFERPVACFPSRQK